MLAFRNESFKSKETLIIWLSWNGFSVEMSALYFEFRVLKCPRENHKV